MVTFIEMEDVSITLETEKHLLNIGKKLIKACPAASKYYMYNLKQLANSNMLKDSKGSDKFCPYCGILQTTENHIVRLQQAPKKNSHLKKLLKLECDQPWNLNNRQKKKIAKFREATNKIVYTCLSCKKHLKVPALKKKLPNESRKKSLYTLPSAKKLKNDLNAGLFLMNSKLIDKNRDTEKNVSSSYPPVNSNPCSTINNTSHSNKLEEPISKIGNKTQSKQKLTLIQPISSKETKSVAKNSFPHGNSSKNKKKKSLLAEILKQEENQKKKTTLSSFLFSI